MDHAPLLTPDQGAEPSSTQTPPDAIATLVIDVGGMRCAGCVKTVEERLKRCEGVTAATVNLVTETALVEGQAGQMDPDTLAQTLTEAGFPSQPRSQRQSASQPAHADEQRRHEMQQQVGRATFAAILLVLSGIGHLQHLGFPTLPGLSNIWFHWGLATVALLGPGRTILKDGWQGLRHNAPNMNTLVGLGTVSAYSASVIALLWPQLGWECFFDEPVMLVSFILLGRTLEQRARNRAADAFRSLLALQPTQARLIADPTASNGLQTSVEISADQVQVGEWLRVLPGEKIPADGKVVTGRTTVNESMLTGESTPVVKQVGETVTAGTLNQSGTIAVQVTRVGQDTTLSQMIALVEAAQTRKAPIQRLADTVAGYFTYGVLSLATLTFLFWYFVGLPLWPDILQAASSMPMLMDHSVHHAAAASPLLLSLKLAIAVLVIACPCALGLATPTAILVGSSIGAERGILIRGGDVLETVHRLDTIVFDKTGTLTTGQPQVTACEPLCDRLDASQLLQFAASVEQGTRHPLADAIQAAARQQGLSLLPADEFHTEPGFGVLAHIDQQRILLGTRDWLIHHGIAIQDTAQTLAEQWAAAGQTVVYIAMADQLIGMIGTQDTLRPDAIAAVQRLQGLGLHVHLLTGDQKTTALAIAQQLQLDPEWVMAEIKPDGKVAAIAQLQAQGQCVAMVGDGINDAPALVQAHVGISLNSSMDVAIEAADIVLMRDKLLDVVESIRLSQSTFNTIRQNLFWAFAYNTLGIPIAAGILLPSLGLLLNPALAGALMAFSSVTVVTNSLLLRRQFPATKLVDSSTFNP